MIAINRHLFPPMSNTVCFPTTSAVRNVFSLTPRGIIEHLDLLRPIYEKTAAYGHFGRSEKEFSWERTDKKEELREAAGASKVRAAVA